MEENNNDTIILYKYKEPEEGYEVARDGDDLKIGVFLDVETTGLSHVTDKIIELGMVKFQYSEDGRIFNILDKVNRFNNPGSPIPKHITKITGITDDMVKDHSWENVDSYQQVDFSTFLFDVDLIISHNAHFDRPFMEKAFSNFPLIPWGCSLNDVNWQEEGLSCRKLKCLASEYKFFYDGHRAVNDCLAGIRILTHYLPVSKQKVMSRLLSNVGKTTYKVWAQNAPYAKKDALKFRGYRWEEHPRHYYKAWCKEVSKLDDEVIFLRDHIYCTKIIDAEADELNSLFRYSLMVPVDIEKDKQKIK